MGFYSNINDITHKIFFQYFFVFVQMYFNFSLSPFHYFFCPVYPIAAFLFCIALPCQSNSTLAPCWIRKPHIQRFAVLSWQAGSQSFLFVSNPMHYFKSDEAFLPESLHQHNVSLFCHLSRPLPLHVLLHSQAPACCSEVSWQWTSSPAGRGITVS